MKQLFLTSSVGFVAHDLVKHFESPVKGLKLAFIDTAAEVEKDDLSWLARDRQSLVDAGFEVENYTLTGKNGAQLKADLDPIDVIYVSGGNSAYLLDKAQQSGFIPLVRDYVLKQGKPYIGTSAGSILAGPSLLPAHRLENMAAAPNLKDFTGFGLVNFVVLPHWGSTEFKDLYLNRRLEHAYQKDQYPLMLLTNNEYVWVKDDWYQLIQVGSTRDSAG